jgi:hypothetical protein
LANFFDNSVLYDHASIQDWFGAGPINDSRSGNGNGTFSCRNFFVIDLFDGICFTVSSSLRIATAEYSGRTTESNDGLNRLEQIHTKDLNAGYLQKKKPL